MPSVQRYSYRRHPVVHGVYSTRAFFSGSGGGGGGGEPSVMSLITRMLAHGAIALVIQYPLKTLLVVVVATVAVKYLSFWGFLATVLLLGALGDDRQNYFRPFA